MRPVDVFDHVVTVVHVFTLVHVQIVVQVHANVHVLVFHVHAIFHVLTLFHVFVFVSGESTEILKIDQELDHDRYLSASSNVILVSQDVRTTFSLFASICKLYSALLKFHSKKMPNIADNPRKIEYFFMKF